MTSERERMTLERARRAALLPSASTAHTLRIASELGLRITRVSFDAPRAVDNNRKL